MPSTSDTFDRVLAGAGRPSASNSFGGSARSMHMTIPTPRVLEAAIIRRPDLARAAWVRRWRRMNGTQVLPKMRHTAGLCCGGEAGKYPSNDYQPPGTPGLYRASPTITLLWTVEPGDNPSTFAYWVTGQGTVARVAELIAANPSKKTQGTPGSASYNFATLVAGEKIRVPTSWNQFITEGGAWGSKGVPYPVRPTAEPLPLPPPPGGTTYAAMLPLGAIAAAKVKLGTWARVEKIAGLSSYPTPMDVNDIIDEQFKAAVRSFQLWSGTKGVTLRTDGVFDEPTDKALTAYVLGLTTTEPPIPPPVTPPVVGLPPLPAVPPVPVINGGKDTNAAASSGGGEGAVLLLALAGFFMLGGK